MTMNEREHEILSRFDSIWARVQPASAPRMTSEQDDKSALRTMIDQSAAAVKVLCALARKEPCCAVRLQALARERAVVTRQMQGAYFLLTGERFTPGASCAVRHESAACLRCLWQTSRNQALHARRCAAETDEPLLQTLYTELADLLDGQNDALRDIVCVLLR